MKLYFSPGACSLSPHIALAESGLPYEIELVNLKSRQTASGEDFDQRNPKGYVPALLLDSGDLLTEGPAIVQYIADQAPDAGLAPPYSNLARYQLQGWLTLIGTELHKSFSPFFNPAATEEWKKTAMANIRRRLDYVNTVLRGQPYLMGEHFTVADAYLYTVLSWGRYMKLELSEWPEIATYQARVHARPAVQRALEAERAAKTSSRS
jgi:glutathione S-transferase